MVEVFSLKETTTRGACEVETDLADSGSQSGSVSNSWLVMLPIVNYHIFPSQRVRARASRL